MFTLALASSSSLWDTLCPPVAMLARAILLKQESSRMGIVGMVYSINGSIAASSSVYALLSMMTQGVHQRKRFMVMATIIAPFILPCLMLVRYRDEVQIEMHTLPRFFCTAFYIFLRGLEFSPAYKIAMLHLYPLVHCLLDDIGQLKKGEYRKVSFRSALKSYTESLSTLSISLLIAGFSFILYHSFFTLFIYGLIIKMLFQDDFKSDNRIRPGQPRSNHDETLLLFRRTKAFLSAACYYAVFLAMAKSRVVYEAKCLAGEVTLKDYVEAMRAVRLVADPWV